MPKSKTNSDKYNKNRFRNTITRNFFDKNTLPKGTKLYVKERIKPNKIYPDVTGVRDIHEFVKKGYFKNREEGQDLYIELKDKKNKLWRLEQVYTKKKNKYGELYENGFFIWYDPKNPPINWDTEYKLQIKKEDLPNVEEKKIIKSNKKQVIIKRKGKWLEKEIKIFESQYPIFKNNWSKYIIFYNGKKRVKSQVKSFAYKYLNKKNILNTKKSICEDIIKDAKLFFGFATNLRNIKMN